MPNTRWNNKLKLDWPFGLVLIVTFGVLRFVAVLYGIQSGNNQYLSILFVAMILVPFVFLSKEGRQFIGFCKPKSLGGMLLSFLAGCLMCVGIYLLGIGLFGNELSNWFSYIGESYPIDLAGISNEEKQTYFIIFVLIGMTFSPFGEELLYRGVVHGSFVPAIGERKAALVDSAAFGITHLAHFGIIYHENAWTFFPVPALLWMTLIFATGMVFNYCKNITNSIWGAIIAHMAFNIMMTYLIFYHLF